MAGPPSEPNPGDGATAGPTSRRHSACPGCGALGVSVPAVARSSSPHLPGSRSPVLTSCMRRLTLGVRGSPVAAVAPLGSGALATNTMVGNFGFRELARWREEWSCCRSQAGEYLSSGQFISGDAKLGKWISAKNPCRPAKLIAPDGRRGCQALRMARSWPVRARRCRFDNGGELINPRSEATSASSRRAT
jgi:hypothetical protein